MKPMPGLDELLARGSENGMFGTKMRSVIKLANAGGVKAVVDQQFEVGQQILNAGLVPLSNPATSRAHKKPRAMLLDALVSHLDQLSEPVMLKLTLPEADNFYAPCVNHANCLKVVALSGGYSREEANARLSCNNGVVKFLPSAEGLSAQQSDDEFTATLDATIGSICEASKRSSTVSCLTKSPSRRLFSSLTPAVPQRPRSADQAHHQPVTHIVDINTVNEIASPAKSPARVSKS